MDFIKFQYEGEEIEFDFVHACYMWNGMTSRSFHEIKERIKLKQVKKFEHIIIYQYQGNYKGYSICKVALVDNYYIYKAKGSKDGFHFLVGDNYVIPKTLENLEFVRKLEKEYVSIKKESIKFNATMHKKEKNLAKILEGKVKKYAK